MAVKARMVNNGQSCIAAKRFIVADAVYEDFRARFVEQMRSALRVGDPDAIRRPRSGPLATAAIRDGLAAQVRRSVEAGARLLTGGKPLPGPGFFYPPTVLEESPPDGSPPPARSCSARWPPCSGSDDAATPSRSPTTPRSGSAPAS